MGDANVNGGTLILDGGRVFPLNQAALKKKDNAIRYTDC